MISALSLQCFREMKKREQKQVMTHFKAVGMLPSGCGTLKMDLLHYGCGNDFEFIFRCLFLGAF